MLMILSRDLLKSLLGKNSAGTFALAIQSYKEHGKKKELVDNM